MIGMLHRLASRRTAPSALHDIEPASQVDRLGAWAQELDANLEARRAARPDRHARAIQGVATRSRPHVERDPLVLEARRA